MNAHKQSVDEPYQQTLSRSDEVIVLGLNRPLIVARSFVSSGLYLTTTSCVFLTVGSGENRKTVRDVAPAFECDFRSVAMVTLRIPLVVLLFPCCSSSFFCLVSSL